MKQADASGVLIVPASVFVRHPLEVTSVTRLRKLFTMRVGPDLGSATVIQPVLTTLGVFTFLAGALYLPSLGPTRVEMVLTLLLLATVALLCTAVGQLTAILERLESRRAEHPKPAAARDPATTTPSASS